MKSYLNQLITISLIPLILCDLVFNTSHPDILSIEFKGNGIKLNTKPGKNLSIPCHDALTFNYEGDSDIGCKLNSIHITDLGENSIDITIVSNRLEEPFDIPLYSLSKVWKTSLSLAARNISENNIKVEFKSCKWLDECYRFC
jgi:hypothetical protein